MVPGCGSISGAAEGAPGIAEAPRFPDAKVLVQSSSILHEVGIILELDRLPREDEEPMLLREPGERYVAGYSTDPVNRRHHFSYEEGHFLVGGFRYPAARNALLFIFRERSDSFSFLFRGRRITVERSGRWKPAVLYHKIEETEDVTPPAPTGSQKRRSRVTSRKTVSRLLSEEIQVGPHRIAAAPGSPEWTVDGARVPAPPRGAITINRQGVRASR
jgi:hypothetical protein